MKNTTKRARPGRPAIYKNPRTSVAARLQAPLHERIKRDAEDAGRSISEEIERRLENSFRSESGGVQYALMSLMLSSRDLLWVTPEHGRELKFSAEAKSQMKERITAFIDSLPEGELQLSLSKKEVEALSELVDKAQEKINLKRSS